MMEHPNAKRHEAYEAFMRTQCSYWSPEGEKYLAGEIIFRWVCREHIRRTMVEQQKDLDRIDSVVAGLLYQVKQKLLNSEGTAARDDAPSCQTLPRRCTHIHPQPTQRPPKISSIVRASKAFRSQWDFPDRPGVMNLESVPACPEGLELLYYFSQHCPTAYEIARARRYQDAPPSGDPDGRMEGLLRPHRGMCRFSEDGADPIPAHTSSDHVSRSCFADSFSRNEQLSRELLWVGLPVR
jgi:hypothetical protein